MKLQIFLLAILLSAFSSNAQELKSPHLLINVDTIHFSIFDTTVYYWKKRFPEKIFNHEKVIYLNNIPVDTVTYSFDYPAYINNQIIINDRETNLFYEVTENGLKKLNIKPCKHIFNTPNNFFLTEDFKIIETIGSNNMVKKLVDLKEYLCNKIPCYGFDEDEYIEEVFQLNEYRFFIRSCTGDIACIYNRYFLFDIKKNQIENITEKVKRLSEKQIDDLESTRIQFTSKDDKFFRGYINKFCGDPIDTFNVRSYLFNQDLEIEEKVLTMGHYDGNSYSPVSISGIKITNSKILNYFLYSFTDQKRNISVCYNFNPHLDILFYKIYHDTIINSDEIISYNQFELNLLKNLIYAKHNYKFTSEFYQAYFNLYEFYNNEQKRESRNENVDALFTKVDIKNLKMINNALKKTQK